MADRFPLILNTSANQIQEIGSGDTLDLTGSNIKGVGIITATNLSGNIIAGAGASNIVSGILTAVAADIDDFVDVGNNIQLGNAGVITATTFKGDGDFVELDVDGHTNLDNVSVGGATTMSGNLRIQNAAPHIYLTDTDGDDYSINVNGGNFEVRSINANSSRLQILSGGTVRSFGNFIAAKDLDVDGHTNLDNLSVSGVATVTGNLNVGGVLTYEDVTNVDSIGIVTARNGLKVTGGTSHFVGVANFNETIVGTARTAIKITCQDESTDTTTYPLFVAATTGDQFPKTGTNLSFNSANGTLTATTFSGALSGNATSADTVDISGAGNANTEFYVTFADANGAAKTIKVDDGIRYNASSNVLTASYFSGNGANLSGLNGSNIASGTVPVARIGTGTKNTSTFYRGDGTFAAVTQTTINNNANNRLITGSGTANTLEGESTLTYNGTSLALSAGKDIRFTTGNWTGEHPGKIQYHSNKMYLQGGSNGHQLRDNSGGTTFEINPSGTCAGVNLTLGQDVTFSGGAGGATIGANSDIRFTTGSWTGEANDGKIQCHGGLLYIQGGSHSNYSIAFRDNGGSDRCYIDQNGHFRPAANNQYDLGTTAVRWRNLYTNDLNLSNEGGANDVDGTWGDYTIQEGESDLFLINNRNGKKYKFNLTEVS